LDNKHWKPIQRKDVDSKTLKIVKGFIDETPNLPVHIHKLLQIVSDSDTESLEVAKAASADPGLVTKILRVINSSYYGLSHKTDNIHFAIVLLGFNEVRKIALETSLSSMFREGKSYGGYDTTGLWEHCYLVSICAEAIGQSLEYSQPGELVTFGMLHDIGKNVLFKLAVIMKKKGIAPYRQVHEDGLSCLSEKEEALFGITHAIAGGMLAEKWDLSERICTILEYHHHPSFRGIDSIPTDYLNDIAMVSISDAIISQVEDDIRHPEPSPEFFDVLGLTPPLEKCLTAELLEKIEEAKRFVKAVR